MFSLQVLAWLGAFVWNPSHRPAQLSAVLLLVLSHELQHSLHLLDRVHLLLLLPWLRSSGGGTLSSLFIVILLP